MINEGYEIYEPEILGDWLAVVKNQAVLVAFLTWLVDQLRPRLLMRFPELSLEVIKVQYLGTYPAFGLKHIENYAPEAIATLMESTIEELLERTPVRAFLEFLFAGDVDWSDVAKQLLKTS